MAGIPNSKIAALEARVEQLEAFVNKISLEASATQQMVEMLSKRPVGPVERAGTPMQQSAWDVSALTDFRKANIG